MNIQISGKGKTIVFLHGYCESLAIWKSFEHELSKIFQVVLIDLPGHGKSPWSMDDNTLEEAGYDIHKLLGTHGIYEYFLIGHSLGGYISLAIAELFPHAVSGIGIVNSTTFPDDQTKKLTRDKVIKYIQEKGIEPFTKNFVPGLFAAESRQKFKPDIDLLIKSSSKTSPAGAIGFAEAMKIRPDRTDILESFAKPVFILAGDQDPAVSKEHAELMMSKIKNGESRMLTNCGHMAFIEAKKESLEFIKAFLTIYSA